jgi:transposase
MNIYDKMYQIIKIINGMYIRKRKNESGSYSVMLCVGERIPGKKNSITKMIKSFGVARDESHLNKLIAEAESYKQHLEQHSSKGKALKILSEDDISQCRSYNTGFLDVYGQAFVSTFEGVKTKEHILDKLKSLVVMRIAEPCSKRKTALISNEYGMSCQVDSLYKVMDQITDPIKNDIKQTIYQRTSDLLSEQKKSIDVLFYDLTTIYFETNTQDELRDFGFSKDGKHQHVQIMVALIVTKEGLPIDYEELPGNSYEGHTLLPVLEKIKTRYQIDKTVIVADAALMNKINLAELDIQGIEYIIAARIKNTKKHVKEAVLDAEGYQVISHLPESSAAKDIVRTKTLATEEGDTLFVYHSTKRARKDAHDRAKALERIEKHLNSSTKSKLTGSLKKSYVKISKDCKIQIDEEKLGKDALFDGFFGLRTNIKEAVPTEILGHYRGLWQVEQTFRIAKSNLEIRPVFHYTPRRIKAHFLLCFMALALIRFVEFTLKINQIPLPPEQLSLLLHRMRKVQITNKDNQHFEILEDPPNELIPIYQILKIKWHKKFQYLPCL